jgi:pyrimidine oxygenase
MDLGVVLPIANGAQYMSLAAPHPKPHFSFLQDITRRAEEYGFDYVFSQVTLRGFGGGSRHWDYQIESIPLLAGLAAATERIGLIGSVAMPTLNPAMAARLCATVADISGDRFELNLVTGWNAAQYSQMGLWPGDHYYGERYEYAEEYATIMKELWANGRSSFKGKYYELEDCELGWDSANVPLICAGQSDRGLRFAAEYGDTGYILGLGQGLEGIATAASRLQAASQASGRPLSAATVVNCIVAPSDDEAKAIEQSYIAHADRQAIANMQGQASLDTAGSTADRLMDVENAVFQNVERVVGSPSTVAKYFDDMAEIEGLSGVLIVFDNAASGLDLFAQEVMPRMRSRTGTLTAA